MATRILPTPEDLRQLLDYDPETGVLTWKARSGDDRFTRGWNTRYAGTPALNANENGYRSGHLGGQKVKSHRAAWAAYYGEWPKHGIDHINGDKTDNRISNLRDVTDAENQKNRPMRADNKSGCTGVYWEPDCQKWSAKIAIDGRLKNLGRFDAKFDAILARLLAEQRLGYTYRHGT